MRLGVFLLFFAIVLATASPPAVAQLSAPPRPDVEKPVKKEKPPKGNEQKPPKRDEPKPPEGEEPEPPEGEEPEPPEGEEPKPPEGGEEGGPDGRDVDAGDDDSAGLDRSTNGSSSEDEVGLSSLISLAGCSEKCDPPDTATNRGEGEAILRTANAESIGELEDDSLAPGAVADASPPVLAVSALFALMVLCLLVGLAGGLRALHGRIRDG